MALIDGKPPTKKQQKLIDAHELKMRERQFENALAESTTRARSVMVGTAFGGVSEISMRRPDGTVTFAILQPVEVVELINQMAASIGCHIHIQPRNDFASWRAWKHSEEELAHFRGVQHQPGVGHPPHVKELYKDSRTNPLPPPEQQPGLQPAMMARSESNEQTVATQKTVGRKRTKRAAAAA
jgi:hypothetical protein